MVVQTHTPMPLRPATTSHHARYRCGFHSAASLAATQAGVKFAAAHNTPALSRPNKRLVACFKPIIILILRG